MNKIHLEDLLGKPFINGGRGPNGYDCWGLVCEVFRRYGIGLPDYRISCRDIEEIDRQVAMDKPKWRRCDPTNPPVPSLLVIRQRGNFSNHTGVYLGAGRFMHTLKKTGVIIDQTESPLWKGKIEGFYVPGWVR